MLLNGFPKLRAEPPPANPVRLTLPITSPVPAEVPVLGIVRMFAPVVRSLVRVSTPLAFALVPRLKPEPAFAMVRLLKVVTDVPPMICAPEPLKFTVFVLAVKVPLLVQLPLTLIVVALVPASVAPASICTLLAVVPLAVNVPACETSYSGCVVRRQIKVGSEARRQRLRTGSVVHNRAAHDGVDVCTGREYRRDTDIAAVCQCARAGV